MSILRIAELLQAMARKEEIAIESKGIKHAPTIGAMYEAVTSDILEKAIPPTADLNVLQGFIRFSDGSLSGQTDCMIVRGEGEKLHDRLDQYIVSLPEVVAVIEVKKSLDYKGLRESYGQLRQISADPVFAKHYDRLCSDAVNGVLGLRVDLMATKDTLSAQQRAVMSDIVQDAYRPARIALGYHGYKSHAGFRSSMLSFLRKNLGVTGFGPSDFPDIMISGEHCLLKINGIPYTARVSDDGWPCLASYSGNPLIPLLEVLWTRLTYARLVPYGIFGPDLYNETLALLLRVRYMPDRRGWECWPIKLSEKELAEAQTVTAYEPAFLTLEQFTVITRLCMVETISTSDPGLSEYARDQGLDVDSFLASLVDTGLVSITDGRLCLLTRMCQCAILPDGRFVAGENISGRFERWLLRDVGGNASVVVFRAPKCDISP